MSDVPDGEFVDEYIDPEGYQAPARPADVAADVPYPAAGPVPPGALRRRTLTGVAVAALAVVVALPILRATNHGEGALSAPKPIGSLLQAPGVGGGQSPTLLAVDFADLDHGYALRADCTEVPGRRCMLDVQATEDGEHWTDRHVPLTPVSHDFVNADIYVLGPSQIAVDDHGVYGQLGNRVYSSDAGRTWTHVSLKDTTPVDAIPADAVAELTCDDNVSGIAGCASTALLSVVLPDSGRRGVLTHQPPITLRWTSRLRQGDQGWWVSGTDKATGQPAVAVSRDAGLSWSASTLPPPGGQTTPLIQAQVVASGSVAYATAMSTGGDGRSALLAVYLSRDQGRSWTLTWQSRPDRVPQTMSGDAVLTDSGELRITDLHGQPYSSTDGGLSFDADPTTADVGTVFAARYGYAGAAASNGGLTVHVSANGARWTQRFIPRY